jgi:hypothetical protein
VNATPPGHPGTAQTVVVYRRWWRSRNSSGTAFFRLHRALDTVHCPWLRETYRMTMTAVAVPSLATDPTREVPTILEAIRIAGINDGMLARALGIRRSAVCNWRQIQMPVHRKRVLAEIVRHVAGLAAPMDETHVLTQRGRIVRNAVAELLKIATEELPPATRREQIAAESEAYRALRALGVKRLDPFADYDRTALHGS